MTDTDLDETWRLFFSLQKQDIVELSQAGKTSFEVPLEVIDRFSGELTEAIVEAPMRVLEEASVILNQEVDVIHWFRPTELFPTSRVPIRMLRHEHLERLVALEGMVVRSSSIRPLISVGVFECMRCSERVRIPQTTPYLEEPLACELCSQDQRRNTVFKLDVGLSERKDSQLLEIQEQPEGMRAGAQPERMLVLVTEDLCGRVQAGDRVIVNGVVQPLTVRKNRRQSVTLDWRLEAVSVEPLAHDFSEVEISEADVKAIKALSTHQDLVDLFIKSLAPTIKGMVVEKMALVLQLFGATPKKREGSPRTRGDIHILLVGDPGTAKSKLLRYVSMLAPRAVYASGQATSKAGLTASAIRDREMDGRFVLEAGVLVLADMGIACIDELDKMNDEDRASMLEGLEQQQISIHKAGINADLKTRCSLLAAANPKFGKFDPFADSLSGQVDLSPELLSRFDAIMFIQDLPDRVRDEALADFLGELYRDTQVIQSNNGHQRRDLGIDPPVPPELFRKYVAYARQNIRPVMDDKTRDRIRDYWVGLRASQWDEGSTPTTPRQLESLYRMSEASARMRLAGDVEMEDGERAIDIMQFWMNNLPMDKGGNIDMGWVTSGRRSQADDVLAVKAVIQSMAKEYPHGAPEEQVIKLCCEQNLSPDEVEKHIGWLKDNGMAYTPRQGVWRLL